MSGYRDERDGLEARNLELEEELEQRDREIARLKAAKPSFPAEKPLSWGKAVAAALTIFLVYVAMGVGMYLLMLIGSRRC